ncbi:MAG: hypothetical protein Q9225_006262 [Loekoesia sp. 1 TL-2023]
MSPSNEGPNGVSNLSTRIANCAEELKALSDEVAQDDIARKELLGACQQTAIYLERPADVIWRYIMIFPTISVIKAALQLGLLDALNASEQPLTAVDLANTIKQDQTVIGLDSSTEGVWQYGHDSSLSLFALLHQHPSDRKIFDTFMSGQRNNRTDWFDAFPTQTILLDGASSDPSSPLIVDIAGGIGSELGAFAKRYPSAPGKLILQDLPETIENSKPTLSSTIEPMAHDIFTPQPVTGARAYYFRAIFHNWPDDKCVEILTNTAKAMKRGYSKVLIHEWVLPDKGAPLQGSLLDVIMMTLSGGKERTETMWRELLGKAGLGIQKVWVDKIDSESLIEAVLED